MGLQANFDFERDYPKLLEFVRAVRGVVVGDSWPSAAFFFWLSFLCDATFVSALTNVFFPAEAVDGSRACWAVASDLEQHQLDDSCIKIGDELVQRTAQQNAELKRLPSLVWRPGWAAAENGVDHSVVVDSLLHRSILPPTVSSALPLLCGLASGCIV